MRLFSHKGVRPSRLILGACLAVAVSGCAVPYGRAISQYQEAAVCCGSMDEFAFEALEIGDSKSFDLNGESPAYQFSTGKSYFKAFSLPRAAHPYAVTVTSYMLGDDVDSAYIFYPQVITLDEDYRPVRRSDPRGFKLERAGFFETLKETGGLMYKLKQSIPFAEDNRAEKYLVVLTADELLKAQTSLSTWRVVPIIIPGVVGAIPVGTQEVLIPHSPAGRIRVSVTPAEKEKIP
jgi:maltose operon protein